MIAHERPSLTDFVYNNVDEGGENLGFNREDTFPLVPPTEGAASLNCIPWEQRRSLPPATAIATMVSREHHSAMTFLVIRQPIFSDI